MSILLCYDNILLPDPVGFDVVARDIRPKYLRVKHRMIIGRIWNDVVEQTGWCNSLLEQSILKMCSYVNWTENESILPMRFPFSVSSLRDQKCTKYHQKHIKVVFLYPPSPPSRTWPGAFIWDKNFCGKKCSGLMMANFDKLRAELWYSGCWDSNDTYYLALNLAQRTTCDTRKKWQI